MIDQVKSVLTFRAFRPEPDDPNATWKNRFSGRPAALLNIGRASLSYVVMKDAKTFAPGGAQKGEIKEVFSVMGHAIDEATSDGWCAVSLDTRYVISVESNLSRKKGSEEAMRKDPRSVLHGRYERGKRYAVTHNPETNSSLLLSCDEEHLKKIEVMCREQRLKIARLCCGTYVLLRYALSKINVKKGSDNPVSALFITCSGGSLCVLSQQKDNWVEIRSRPDVYDGDLESLMELISPFNERIADDGLVVLACDQPIPGLPERLREVFAGHELNDLTEPALLARLVYEG